MRLSRRGQPAYGAAKASLRQKRQVAPVARRLHVPASHRSLDASAATMYEPDGADGPAAAAVARNSDPGACYVIQGASRGLGLEMCRLLLERTAGTVVATCRNPDAPTAAGLRAMQQVAAGRLCCVVYDPEHADEGAASMAASAIRGAGGGRVDLLVNTAGMLHDSSTGNMPEKALRMVTANWLQRSFAVHTTGPLLLIQALAPLLRVKKNERPPSAVVNISARVGSIQDNNLGGWYSYRITKAAQNQATRTAALEMARHGCWVMALHPGTVDTNLSIPFQGGLAEGQLRPLAPAARQLLDLIDGMDEEDAGAFYAWDGTRLPW